MAKPSETAPVAAADTPAAPTFESALSELEGIVAAMEAGQMPLQESLDAYRRGMELLRSCRETLNAAEQQLRILDSGELREFDPQRGGPAPDKLES